MTTKLGKPKFVGTKDGDTVFREDKTRKGAPRRWIMHAVEESLTRLKTDYIDLYQVHVADPETPREETLRALGEAATFATADDLNTSQAIAAANGLTSFVTMEANCSILVRDAEKAIRQ